MSFTRKYLEISAFLDEKPEWRADWKWLAAIIALGYCAAVGVRLIDAGEWQSPGLMAGGQVIMATHDAYGWLAGAKGVNSYAPYGMSWLARSLNALTGTPLWKIGFWAPAYLGGLTAIAAGLWAWLLAGRRAAIAAACLGALSPGFYFRSRLGYYDSDAFTLFMPLLLSFLLAHLLSFCCRRSWLPEAAEDDDAPPAWLPWLAVAYGLVARVAHFAHDDILHLGVIMFWMAAVLATITARPGRRLLALQLLVVYALAGYAGHRLFSVEVFTPHPLNVAGVAAAASLAALLWRKPARVRPVIDHPWVWVAALFVAAALGDMLMQIAPFWDKVMSYFKPVADTAQAGGAAEPGPAYPGITQSIREARNVANWRGFLSGMAPSAWVGGAGGLGVLAILLLRPALTLMLPLIGIGAASLYMGVRFAMFGGPAFALGLGIGAHWLAKALLHKTGAGTRTLVAFQAGLAAVGILAYVTIFSSFHPTPVLAPPHAAALLKLKDIAPKGSQVWTWWDYGYATQYYAERMTPSDGGRHAGRDIYPTALALSTPSYRQAAQMILLSASLDGDPARVWDKMPAKAVNQQIASLAQADVPIKRAAPQYIVVCWENMALLHWISFYGSWNVASGTGTHARTQDVLEAFNIDPNRGAMAMRSAAAPILLGSMDKLTPQGLRRLDFPANPGAPHLIMNDVARQAILIDDQAYYSMAVQLLINDPARPELARYFKLVHEGFPLVRIYEILPPAAEPQGQAEAFKQ